MLGKTRSDLCFREKKFFLRTVWRLSGGKFSQEGGRLGRKKATEVTEVTGSKARGAGSGGWRGWEGLDGQVVLGGATRLFPWFRLGWVATSLTLGDWRNEPSLSGDTREPLTLHDVGTARRCLKSPVWPMAADASVSPQWWCFFFLFFWSSSLFCFVSLVSEFPEQVSITGVFSECHYFHSSSN